ncbi:MAG TPA: DNA mismatch endonuclease Vsr [Tepidisphaeraceae bacterium]|nr:DNA mismatch endonuclease Vsr [Tepidisphaeraceae bacterium]
MTTVTADFLTTTERSALMRRVRSTGTGPELALAAALKERGHTFELHCENLPGKPDIVFQSQRVAVFVDGEFWHGGQWQRRGLISLADQFPDATKRGKWLAKIQGNRNRDLARTADLVAGGWTVVRLWAGEIERDTASAVDLILRSLSKSAPPSPASWIAHRHAAEFFAGIGLARIALERSGWRVSFANDKAEDKILFYSENLGAGGAAPDTRDIHDIAATDVPTVALATACFPCTDLSLAGAQRGLEPGTESSAYLKFTAVLRQMKSRRPPFVLLENVVGMIHSRGGADFQICLEQLRDAGYTVDPFLLDAKWFVPQSRPRFFVVAVRDDLRPLGHHTGTADEAIRRLRPARLIDFIKAHPDLPWSLRPLPVPGNRTVRLEDIVEDIPFDDSRWWTAERSLRLYRQMSDKHRKIVRGMMKSTDPKYGTVFRRMRHGSSMAELRTDGLAGCLRTPKGGSARQILLRASSGKYHVRLLTPRECARLMGADDIRIPEALSVNKALFAFGDGVCVPVVKWIADNYLTPLAAELIHGAVLRTGSVL